MLIQSVQQQCTHIWARVEPLVAPAAVGMGATLLVSYVYGSVAACCFGACLVGAAIEYHDLIVQVSKNEIFVGIARLVAMAVLPLFGTWGIVGSVGIAIVSSFSVDVRLYSIRQKQKQADQLIQEIQKQRQQLQKDLEAMTEERDETNRRLEAFWKTAKPVEAIVQTIDRYEVLIRENQEFLQKKLQQEDYTSAVGILEDITQFKAFITKKTQESLELAARVRAISEKLEAYVNN